MSAAGSSSQAALPSRRPLSPSGLCRAPADATPSLARVSYPTQRIGNVKDLKVDQPVEITYPDKESPGVLLKLGRRVEGGVGPDGDIVAFTTLCPHKGFPLAYVAADKTSQLPRSLFPLRL